jgi:WD40 repeat protein
MRVIDADLGEVRAVAVSPDGRLVAASGAQAFGVFGWASGELHYRRPVKIGGQVAFGPGGDWVTGVIDGRLLLHRCDGPAFDAPLQPRAAHQFGGLTVSPDGKVLVAAGEGSVGTATLQRWALPALQPITGFDFWPPARRLAFSPDAEFLAGIWWGGFELRFANSGGLDYRHRMPRDHTADVPGFVSFDRGSATCAFGWADEFHLLDVSTGTSKPGPRVPADFRDAAFSPGADMFATVGDDGRLKLWDPGAWRVVREYDWGCGALTALAFTADGSAGVCGTADGRLVQFDVDE